MKIEIGNKIVIHEPTEQIVKWCRNNLILDNPDYYKKARMGLWTGNTPETIQLYERVWQTLILPFGCLKKIWPMCSGAPYSIEISPFYAKEIKRDISLYPYQEKAVDEAIKAKNGVIVMPCGAGKTQTALEIIARLGGRTLWLTHTHELLMQSMRRAKGIFDLPDSEYGTITEGKVDVRFLTFATVQTMAKIDLSTLKDAFDVVVVDECHKAIGSPTKVMQFYKVLSGLSCRYKFGLTATPYRSDHLEKSMFALLGDVICEISRDEVSDRTCPVHVKTFRTNYYPTIENVLGTDGVLQYAKLVEDLTNDKERFDIVLNTIAEECAGPTIVLANRVEYLQRLCEEIEKKGKRCICISGAGTSKKAKAEREAALRKLNEGELDCIFASYQLAAEGLDCPNLRYVVFATPEKDKTTVIQAAGRVARKAEGKDHGEVVDFVDDFGMYRNWAKRRKKIFENLGFSIDTD